MKSGIRKSRSYEFGRVYKNIEQIGSLSCYFETIGESVVKTCQSVTKKLVMPKGDIPTVAIRKLVRAAVLWRCVPSADSADNDVCPAVFVSTQVIISNG